MNIETFLATYAACFASGWMLGNVGWLVANWWCRRKEERKYAELWTDPSNSQK